MRLAAALAMALLSLLGAADAAYLTHLKQQKDLVGVADSPLCQRFSATGCDVALSSPVSAVAGVPVSAIALGAYAVLLGLAVARVLAARRPAPDPSARPSAVEALSALLVLGAVAWSAVLGTYSARTGRWCPACVGLYIVNALLLLTTAGALRGGPARLWRALMGGRKPLIAVIVGFVAVTGAVQGYAAWRLHELLPLRQKFDREQVEKALARGLMVLPPADLNFTGPEDAPLEIVKFSDLECPHCRKYFLALEAIQAAGSPALRIAFRHFPLSSECNPFIPNPFHEHACGAALAALCAQDQGRLFDFLKGAFDAQPDLGPSALDEIGAELGLDLKAFGQCRAAPATRARLDADVLAGRLAGVEGTPASVVNGLFFEGGFGTHTLNWLAESLPKRLADTKPPPSPLMVALAAQRAAAPLELPGAAVFVGSGSTRVDLVVSPDVSSEPLQGAMALALQLPRLARFRLLVAGDGPMSRFLVCGIASEERLDVATFVSAAAPAPAPADNTAPAPAGNPAPVPAASTDATEAAAHPRLTLETLRVRFPAQASCAASPRASELLAASADAIAALGGAQAALDGRPLVLPPGLTLSGPTLEQAIASARLRQLADSPAP